MKGWQIFRHSILQVTGNLDAALRVSGVLYLAQFVVGSLLVGGMAMSMNGPADMIGSGMGAGFALGSIVALIVAVGSSLWIAVGWHRYVLTSEKPEYLPRFHGDRIWAYFLRGLLIGAVLIPAFLLLGLIVGIVGGATDFGPVVVVLSVLLGVPVWIIGLRMSASLPGVALGVHCGIRDAWEATRDDWGTFVALAVILIILSFGLGMIGMMVFPAIGLGVIWNFAFGWLQMMVGVSILTTLYGHYIEKRDLV